MLRCNTCGGKYEPTMEDGLRYFHACPPTWDGTAKRFVERANKRDENVVQGPPNPKTGMLDQPGTMKLAGAGVTKL